MLDQGRRRRQFCVVAARGQYPLNQESHTRTRYFNVHFHNLKQSHEEKEKNGKEKQFFVMTTKAQYILASYISRKRDNQSEQSILHLVKISTKPGQSTLHWANISTKRVYLKKKKQSERTQCITFGQDFNKEKQTARTKCIKFGQECNNAMFVVRQSTARSISTF